MLTVHLVDDEPLSRQTAMIALEDLTLAVVESGSGGAVLDSVGDEDSHDIVLLDIEMPGMDGLEVCRRLRASGHANKTVIFISGHNDLETRLAAYEVGGNDFLIKPYDLRVLQDKVRVLLEREDQRRSVHEQVSYATRTAFTAMTSMGELGQALEFLRNCLRLASADEVASALLETIAAYGLSPLVQLRAHDGQLAATGNYAPAGPCSELEASILSHAAGLARIFTIGNRMAINYPHATLLASGLDKNDPERTGRLRDHLAIIVEAADARIETLLREQASRRQAEGIVAAASHLGQNLRRVDETNLYIREQTKRIADNLLYNQERAIWALKLPAAQEQELMALAVDAVSRIANLQIKAADAAQSLQAVAEELNALVA